MLSLFLCFLIMQISYVFFVCEMIWLVILNIVIVAEKYLVASYQIEISVKFEGGGSQWRLVETQLGRYIDWF